MSTFLSIFFPLNNLVHKLSNFLRRFLEGPIFLSVFIVFLDNVHYIVKYAIQGLGENPEAYTNY